MGTTKSVQNSFKELKTVTPTKSLLITSMPCEKIAAHIRNETVNAIKDSNDNSRVSYRYLQNKRGEKSSLHDIGMFSFIFLLAVCAFSYDIYNRLQQEKNLNNHELLGLFMHFFVCAGALGHLLPAFSNIKIYKESKDACADWLSTRIDKRTFEEMQKLPINKDSPFKLFQLLEKNHINITDKHFDVYKLKKV